MTTRVYARGNNKETQFLTVYAEFDGENLIVVGESPYDRWAFGSMKISFISDAALIAAGQMALQRAASTGRIMDDDHIAITIVSLARKIEDQRRAQKA